MNNFKYLFVVFVLAVGVFFFLENKPVLAPVVPPVATNVPQTIELCFAKKGQPNVRGYADKYTLRLSMTGDQATGELNLWPAEKDSKVGKFTGTVSAVDKVMMARTASLWWDTMAEGTNTKEQLSIIFGEGTANIGFGEMVDRGDGVYVYKDLTKVAYNLALTDVACDDAVFSK